MKYLIFKRWFLKYLRWFLKVASERMGSKLGWRRRRRGKNASSGRTRFYLPKIVCCSLLYVSYCLKIFGAVVACISFL